MIAKTSAKRTGRDVVSHAKNVGKSAVGAISSAAIAGFAWSTFGGTIKGAVVAAAIIALLFLMRMLETPAWLHTEDTGRVSELEKTLRQTSIGLEHAQRLEALFDKGNTLYAKRVSSNAAIPEWTAEVESWIADVEAVLIEVKPGEAFAFRTIGFHHRNKQDLRAETRCAALRAELQEKLVKLRLITGRKYEGAAPSDKSAS